MAEPSTKSIRLVSWTLAGPGTAPIIGDALRSAAPLVGRALVVWTGERDALREIHDNIRSNGYGGALEMRLWSWRNDYAAARNEALACAAETDADWGCMLDTDERILCPDPAALRAFLSALPSRIVVALAHHNDGSHTRERFFRLPAAVQFTGRTHEMFPVTTEQQAIIPREIVQWSELPKTPEQLHAKFERDVAMLREDIRDNPRNGAAHYYLGTSLQALGRHDDAIEAFREHRRIDTAGSPAWHEGTAFSCYRAAECYLALGQPDRAIDCAAAGLVLDAGIGELYWIAAVASLQAGRPEQARAWAESATAHGYGSASEARRVGFRVPEGLSDGPAKVIAEAQAFAVYQGNLAWADEQMKAALCGAP